MTEHIIHKDKLERYRGLILQFSIILSLLIVLMLFENKTKSAELIPRNYTAVEFTIESGQGMQNPVPPIPGDTTHMKEGMTQKKEAHFPGGVDAFYSYVQDNIQYNEEAKKKDIQGRVIVSFTIDEQGKVKQPEVIRSIHPLLDTEALRLIKNMPDWEPEMINSNAISSSQTESIIFLNE